MIRRRFVAALTFASLLALVPTSSSAATGGTIVFYGSGFGHGIGMSQWGAYGLAQKGWTHQHILTHYYSRTTVAAATSEPAKIRVGLVDGTTAVHLRAVGGPVTLRVGSPRRSATTAAIIPAGQTYAVKGGSGKFRVLNGSGTRVGSAIDGTKRLYATYRSAGAMVASPEAGHTYNRGWIELDDAQACSTCGYVLRMIAILSPQDYLYGLGEVPPSWPMEAMEAQADAARTYAEYLIRALGQSRAGCNCGVYDDSRNQVYAGWDHEGESQGTRWVHAVDATAGEVVLYRGALIEAQYTSSSGGYTENNENVWGGSPVPYLRGVCDPGDYTAANPARSWRVSMTTGQVTSRLAPYTGNIGTVRRFTRVVRGVSGRIRSVTVVGSSGSRTIAGSTLRGALGLLDDRVWINSDRNVTGAIRGKYDSLGCAPGMPTSPQATIPGGVVQRFVSGAIYHNVQAGRVVWLHGPIEDEYVSLKGSSGVLGPPLTNVVTLTAPSGCDHQRCARARFANGMIYFRTDAGAHEVHGFVRDYYLSRGGASGHLGFPTTDVTPTTSGGSQATFSGTGGGAVVVTCAKGGTCTESPAK